MTVRCTLRCPILSQFPAKGISPDAIKTMTKSEIYDQDQINKKYNARGNELGDILISKLADCDITWCNDGCLVVSCSNTLAEMEKVIADEGLEIQPDRPEIKHKVKEISKDVSEEDIDEVFEPLAVGELKKLKSKTVVNQFKTKSIRII